MSSFHTMNEFYVKSTSAARARVVRLDSAVWRCRNNIDDDDDHHDHDSGGTASVVNAGQSQYATRSRPRR